MESHQRHYQEHPIIIDDRIKVQILISIRIVKDRYEKTFLSACIGAPAWVHLANASAYFNFIKVYLRVFAGPLVPGDEFQHMICG